MAQKISVDWPMAGRNLTAHLFTVCSLALVVSGCGGGGGGGGGTGGNPPSTPPTTYTVGGTVSGLSGSGLIIQNGADTLTLSANGPFTFPTAAGNAASYFVHILGQPRNPVQTCTVSRGAGTIAGSNVTNVAVTCTTNTYTVGVSVAGLRGTGLILQNSGGDDLAINADGAFTFPAVTDGSGYNVTVLTQPTADPTQTCRVGNGSGTIQGSNVVSVHVQCSWTKQFGTIDHDEAAAVATDSAGNIYVVGRTYGVMDGSNAGAWDIFVIKYAPSGATLWTQQFGTAQQDSASGIAIDANDNVYVTGWTFGAFEGANVGQADLFLAKFNAGGNQQWIRQLGTTSWDESHGVALDSTGIYVAGFTSGSLDGNTSAGSADLFITKYNDSGTRLWTRQYGALSNDTAHAIAADGNGSVYVAGSTQNNLDGVHAGAGDMFIVKYDANGNRQWTRQRGSSETEEAYAIALDTQGFVYVTGSTMGGLDGNQNGGGTDVLPADLFVVKYQSDGTYVWTRQFGSDRPDNAYGIAIDAGDNVYVTGGTRGELDGNINPIGDHQGFLIKYSSAGDRQWSRQFGGNQMDAPKGVAIHNDEGIYIAGTTSSGIDGSPGLDFNLHIGGWDAFIVRYDSDGIRQ